MANASQPGADLIDLGDASALYDLLTVGIDESWESHPEETPPEIRGYRPISLLGSGGMGAVWRAQQLSTGREVAIKMLRRDAVGDRTRQRLFDREARLAAELEHPNIARIYDSGFHDNQLYVVMELVDGLIITDYSAAHELGTCQILELVARACDAVQHAHLRGVVHRDLKPSNILVKPDGSPRVIDFGVATAAGGQPTHVAGTPAYMAPEQASAGGVAGPAADVFSLGMILRHLLGGRPPRDLPSGHAESLAAVRAGADAVSMPRRLPRKLTRILDAATAPAPAARYPSAGALADDLRRYVAGRPLKADAGRPAAHVAAAIGRHPITALCLLVAAVLSAGVTGWAASAVRYADQVSESQTFRAEAASLANALQSAHVHIAQEAFAPARAALESVPPATRGWEWRLLQNLADQSSATVDHEDHVLAAGFDAQAASLVSVDQAGTLKTKALAGGETRVIRLQAPRLLSASFSASGRMLAAGDAEGVLRLWQLPQRDPAHELRLASSPITAVVVSADEQRVAVATRQRVHVLSVDDFRVLLELDASESLTRLAFSEDGRLLAVVSDRVRVFSMATGETVSAVETSGIARAATFVGDGLIVGFDEGRIGLYGVNDGVERWRTTSASAPTALLVDGERLIVGTGDGRLQTRLLSSGEVVETWGAHGQTVASLTGASVAGWLSIGTDRTVKLWPRRRPVPDTRMASRTASAWSLQPATGLAAWFDGSGILVEDVVANVQARVETDVPVSCLAIAPSGTAGAAGGDHGELFLWDAATGEQIRLLPNQGTQVWGLAFSPDSSRLAVATTELDGAIRIYSTNDGKAIASFPGDGPLAWMDDRTLVYQKPGRRIVSQKIGGEPVGIGRTTGAPTAVVCGGDGRVAVATQDGVIEMFDGRRGLHLGTTQRLGRGSLLDVAFTADGTRLVACGDGVFILEPRSRQLLVRLDAGPGAVVRAAHLADADQLVTLGVDRLVVWRSE